MAFPSGLRTHDRTMMRVTRVPAASPTVLRVEGRVVGGYAGILEEECRRLQAAGEAIRLDMAHVEYADPRGVAGLRQLRRSGVELLNCNPLMTELLEGEGGS